MPASMPARPKTGADEVCQACGMIALSRFRVPAADVAAFRVGADDAVKVLSTKDGMLSIDLAQNLDDRELWTITSRWSDIGSYRRALGGLESKMVVVPLLSLAIDEPSAFEDPDQLDPIGYRGGA